MNIFYYEKILMTQTNFLYIVNDSHSLKDFFPFLYSDWNKNRNPFPIRHFLTGNIIIFIHSTSFTSKKSKEKKNQPTWKLLILKNQHESAELVRFIRPS